MASERRVLVVGATGILRPAALQLAAAGDTVVAVARGRVRLTALEAEGGHRVEVLPLDVGRATAVDEARAPGHPLGRPLDAAVVYAPRPVSAGFGQVLERVTGTVVRILTSSAADPAHGDAASVMDLPWARITRPTGRIRLLLGWSGPTAAPRWHTPEEVSAAALDALARGEDTVLGRVRPWQERPT